MTVKLNSYIGFNGNAREAMEFYKTVFGGELSIDTFENYADSMPVVDADKNKIMHAFLKGENGIELMAADTPTGMERSQGSQISLALNGDNEMVLRGYWDALSKEGTVTMPLEKSSWGSSFGMVTDKFGVNWMVDISSVQQ